MIAHAALVIKAYIYILICKQPHRDKYDKVVFSLKL